MRTAEPTIHDNPVPAQPAQPLGTARGPRTGDRTGGERGFAMVWFGLVLIVLLTMAGAAIDVWNWWYNGNLNQRAADASALGGVVFMPEDSAQAHVIAMDIAEANGVDPADVTIETEADDPLLAQNELRVIVSNRVNTRFLKLVGVTGAEVSRDAVAQYTSRLPMGSPEQYLGRDPDRGFDPGFWLSVSGRGESKIGGDRYQNITCGSGIVYNCNGGTSTEYSEQGYAFSVELNSAPTGDLQIEIFDPVHTETGAQDCTNTGYLSQAVYDANKGDIYNSLALLGIVEPNATTDARYAAGDTIFCQGDVGGGTNPSSTSQNVTTFIVREPDNTQALDFDNPAIDTGLDPNTGCTRQFRAVDLSPGGSTNRGIYSILNLADRPLDVPDLAEGAYTLRNYRRWVPLCTIPQATVANWYASGLRSVIVQVRSNADLNAPFVASTTGRSGRNHFALRAGYGTATTTSGVSMFAQGRLPIHNGASGSSTEFFLTRIPPGNAGRTLSLEFYDVADASQPATFRIIPPAGFGGSFSDCIFIRYSGNNDGTNTGQNMSADASGCTLSNVNNSRYNGRVTDVRVRVPAGYTCVLSNPLDCWIKVEVAYSSAGKVFDHTVWDAGVVGEPVRLVE